MGSAVNADQLHGLGTLIYLGALWQLGRLFWDEITGRHRR